MGHPRPSFPWSSLRLASLKITAGDLPPHSKVTFFKLTEACCWINLPTPVDPVKEILSISSWPTMADPVIGPNPERILTAPGGNPASLINWAKYNKDIGVFSADLITTVLPAARAPCSFHEAMASG
ncbi:hypothetical protein WICPIJ_004444 [Wickerhamomyces pijperi]|uniref:Uncharacterized protein n=1 Tax=Wickerhamomyces pijperi TaxID=599730 RepID=A0A9P8Q812_WICPI|nr:hypothetical protein WICPIJ_004444 [Wickerhamomyces pijperi]